MLSLLRKIMFPFSLIYALVVYIRNFMFDVGIFKSLSYPTPTICVGNLSVGGTGKTPMIEYLIRLLKGHRIAVLSRGYKRKSKGFLLATPHSAVTDLGDEPYQLHRKFPGTTIAVDADRRNGITQLEKLEGPEVILLDDAFQHRKVKPTFSILLTAYNDLFVNDWYLPMGNLRDAKKEAKRANLIIVTKCPNDLSEMDKTKIRDKINHLAHQHLLFANLEYSDAILNGTGDSLKLLSLKGKLVALVTGIASPGPLVKHLESQGIDFQHFEFGDHHHFADSEIQKFKGFEIVLTTEKDFVRLEGRVQNLFYLEIAHNFQESDREILKTQIIGLL